MLELIKRLAPIFMLVFLSSYMSGQVQICQVQNPSVNNENGSICLDFSSNAGPFIYLINKNGEFFLESNNPIAVQTVIDNLGPGLYEIFVLDSKRCSSELEVELIEVDCFYDLIITTIGHVTECNNSIECGEIGCSNDGFIEAILQSTISQPPLIWTGPNNFVSTDISIYNLVPGRYELQVNVDSENCPARDPIVVIINACEEVFSFEDIEGAIDCNSTNTSFAEHFELTIENVSYLGGSDSGPGGISASITNDNNMISLYWVDSQGNIYDNETIKRTYVPEIYCPILTGSCGQNIELDCIEIKLCTELNYDYDIRKLISCNDDGKGIFEINNLSGDIEESTQISWVNLSTNTRGFGDIDPLENGTYLVYVENDKNCTRLIEEFTVPIQKVHRFNYSIKFDRAPMENEPGIVTINVLGDPDDAPFTVKLINPNPETESIEQTISFRSGSATFRDIILPDNNLRYQIYDKNGNGIDCNYTQRDCSNSPNLYFDIEGVDPYNTFCDEVNDLEITLLIDGGTPWYYVSAKLESSLSGEDWMFEQIVMERFQEVIIPNVPEGRINIEVADDCGNIKLLTISTCNHLLCEYEVGNDNVKIFDGAFKIEQDCECLTAGCFNIFEAFGNNRDLRINLSEQTLVRHFEFYGITSYEIIWPTFNGRIDERIDLITVDENGVSLNDGSDLDIPDDIEAGTYFVTVERSDGCIVEIPFEFVEDVEFSTFNSIPIDDETAVAYNFVTNCVECASKMEIEENFEELCTTGETIINKFWRYIPYDLNNPCYGGGELIFGGVSILGLQEPYLTDIDTSITLTGQSALRQIDGLWYGQIIHENTVVPQLIVDGCVNIFVEARYTCIFETPFGLADYFNPTIPLAVPGYKDFSVPDCEMEVPDDIIEEGGSSEEENSSDFNCDFNINQNGFGEGFSRTYQALPVGTRLRISYSFRGLEDQLIITGGGIYYNGEYGYDSGCVPETGGAIVEVTESTPISIFVSTNCLQRGKRSVYSVNVNCVEEPGLNQTDTRSEEILEVSTNNEIKTRVYPNPFSSEVNVEIENELRSDLDLFVTDLSGKVVLSKTITSKKNSFNLLKEYPAGLYQLRIKDSKSYDEVYKLIKIND